MLVLVIFLQFSSQCHVRPHRYSLFYDLFLFPLIASTCFLGTRIGMEVYVKLPENFKGTLKAGKGKIKVYVILALISYTLMNIDDRQDFSNLLTKIVTEA